jgi:hypothetical protein
MIYSYKHQLNRILTKKKLSDKNYLHEIKYNIQKRVFFSSNLIVKFEEYFVLFEVNFLKYQL